MVILGLFSYFVSRVYVAYTKLQADKIGTLFDRITSRTVKVLNCKNIFVATISDFVSILNKYPAITSCVYHEENDDLKNLNDTFNHELRKDIITKYIYYFKDNKDG